MQMFALSIFDHLILSVQQMQVILGIFEQQLILHLMPEHQLSYFHVHFQQIEQQHSEDLHIIT